MNSAGTISPEIEAALRMYIEHGMRPGEFLTAVLCNDLMSACLLADEERAQMLPAIMHFLCTNAPAISFGSEARMFAWTAK